MKRLDSILTMKNGKYKQEVRGGDEVSRWSGIKGRKLLLTKLGRILAQSEVFKDREWRPLPGLSEKT